MLVICPNCKKEFFVGNELIGYCPFCNIKLVFRNEGEVVEKVDIKEIEEKVDKIIEKKGNKSILNLFEFKDLLKKEKIKEIERKVDLM